MSALPASEVTKWTEIFGRANADAFDRIEKLLVVDDDSRLRDLLVRYLGEQGLEVKAVGDAAQPKIARVDVPFRKDFLLRMDMPFLKWSDPDRPGVTSRQGFSDLAVTAGGRAYNTPEYAVLLGVVSTMPTAAETGLGLGKYTVGPTIATARFLPRWDSFLIGVFTQQVSVGGDPDRSPVNRSKFIGQINSFWAERWWTIAQAVWQVDWERNGKGSMTLEPEVGRSLVGRFGMFIRPGVGVFGRDLLGAYDWNVEAGVRYMFPSF